MRNKIRVRCSDCGEYVEIGEGESVRMNDNSWNTTHDDCETAGEPEATDVRFNGRYS